MVSTYEVSTIEHSNFYYCIIVHHRYVLTNLYEFLYVQKYLLANEATVRRGARQLCQLPEAPGAMRCKTGQNANFKT